MSLYDVVAIILTNDIVRIYSTVLSGQFSNVYKAVENRLEPIIQYFHCSESF